MNFFSTLPSGLSAGKLIESVVYSFFGLNKYEWSLSERMINVFLFCDQVVDSHETHQKVQLTNQSAGNWKNSQPVE